MAFGLASFPGKSLSRVMLPQMDFSWTTGGDPTISYGKPIGSGGYAEVHEVSLTGVMFTEITRYFSMEPMRFVFH